MPYKAEYIWIDGTKPTPLIKEAIARDFGSHAGERYLRLSYASSMESVTEAVARLHQLLTPT
mgnify:CR=1 FL=1